MTKTFTLIFGVILALLGLLGFVSNPFIGADAFFATNDAVNWLHLVVGVLMIAVSLFPRGDSRPDIG